MSVLKFFETKTGFEITRATDSLNILLIWSIDGYPVESRLNFSFQKLSFLSNQRIAYIHIIAL